LKEDFLQKVTKATKDGGSKVLCGLNGVTFIFFLLVALGVAGLLQSVSAYHPIAIGTGIVVLTVAAFIACLLPDLRAARIDPTAVLRSE
jgi:ABC-type antimicrobial peptide transport system permease subunit